jgi:uncharacterized SAM-binding protein YcdF (DUF218 family)
VKRSASWLRIMLIQMVCVAAFVSVIGMTLGRDAAEKIGTALVMPGGLVWLSLIALCLQLFLRRRSDPNSPGAFGALVCLLLYSVAGSGIISGVLARHLEGPYFEINPLQSPVPDLIVVLGGGGMEGANGRFQGNSSGDRMILAAQLYHQSPETRFLCTGQRIESMTSSAANPAEVSRDVLLRLGVPDSSIELVGGRNTSEEMKHLAERFAESQQTIGLLTSAWHLPRATRLARRNGLNTLPIPADFRSSPPGTPPTIGQRIEGLIPNGGAFGSNWSFAKEYLGMLIGR